MLRFSSRNRRTAIPAGTQDNALPGHFAAAKSLRFDRDPNVPDHRSFSIGSSAGRLASARWGTSENEVANESHIHRADHGGRCRYRQRFGRDE
jgi:hypothetical protein